tara:strand:- start:635 stop:2413 length:1779 start_codon:yes stop_codon:yes gene_type:complete
MAEAYIDVAIRRQALLERLKSGQVRDFVASFRDVEALIRSAFGSLEDDIGEATTSEVNALIRQLRDDQGTIFRAAVQSHLREGVKIAALTHSQELLDLAATVDLRGTKLDKFTSKALFAKVIKRPLTTEGHLLKPWLDDWSTKEVNRVSGIVRTGHAQGKTNKELIRELVGTRANRFKDGALEISRRNAETVVRTSVQHVASSARQETWEANRDVVDRYQFVATLDGKTSKPCRTLDGQKFDFGKGPIPPIHPRCRSTTIPVLAQEFDFLSKGRTRSSETGPVDAENGYYDWLKDQPPGVQDTILGEKRGKLFRDGGMSPKRFRDLQFDRNFEPLTLEEMRELEPEAFAKAFPDIYGDGGTSTVTTVGLAPWDTRRGQLRKLVGDGDEAGLREALKLPTSARGTLNVDTVMPAAEETFGVAKAYLEEHLPPDRLEAIARGVKTVLRRKGSRAVYKASKLELVTSGNHSTTIHELAHALEYQLPGWSKRSLDFLDKRAGSQPIKRLSVLTGNRRYRRTEWAWEDEWKSRGGNHYMGKDYRRTSTLGRVSYPDAKATELITMGIERLRKSPLEFAQRDPEYFEWLVQTLQHFGG